MDRSGRTDYARPAPAPVTRQHKIALLIRKFRQQSPSRSKADGAPMPRFLLLTGVVLVMADYSFAQDSPDPNPTGVVLQYAIGSSFGSLIVGLLPLSPCRTEHQQGPFYGKLLLARDYLISPGSSPSPVSRGPQTAKPPGETEPLMGESCRRIPPQSTAELGLRPCRISALGNHPLICPI